MTRTNNIYPLVGDPRTITTSDEFSLLFEQGKQHFLLSLFNAFHEAVIKSTSQTPTTEMAYYWDLVSVLQEKGKDSHAIHQLIQKDLDSRLKNIHVVQLPNCRYSTASHYAFQGRLVFAEPNNMMFKDFDSLEAKYITLTAIRIIQQRNDIKDFNESLLSSPASFRDFVLSSIRSIRHQHAGHISFYDFQLSSLNFILEHQNVIKWALVIKGLKGGSKA